MADVGAEKKFCINCGTAWIASAKFCSNCGNSSGTDSPNSELSSSLSTNKSEKVLFDDKGVKITNARFVSGNATYSIANITSVRYERTDSNKLIVVTCTLSGLLSIFLGYIPFSICLFIIAIVAYMADKKFKVIFITSAGESTGYEGKDLKLIEQIVEALNQAIVERG